MTRHRVTAEYMLLTKGPLHVGTGHGAGGLDRTMLRSKDGLPYIPGSTIKGRARYAAVRICDWMGLPVLKDTVADVLPDGNRGANGPGGRPDLPNSIFGHAWSRCTLRFEDARPAPNLVAQTHEEIARRLFRDRAHGLREIRTGAARSRLLGTVSHRRLYQAEVAQPGLTLSGRVVGYLNCADAEHQIDLDCPAEILVLWLALHLMVEDGVGGGKAAGNGKLAWAPSGRVIMRVDDQDFEPQVEDVSSVLSLLCDVEGAGAAE